MRRINLLRAHGSPTGYQYLADGCRCAVCLAQQSERRRRRYAANPEAGREASRRYRLKHPERQHHRSEYGKLYRRDNPAKVEEYRRQYRATNRNKVLLAKYGLTGVEWDAMLAAQGGKCAICGSSEPRGNRWHTDHDHDAGTVRGILCHLCNVGIGCFQDSPAGLIAAAEYLRASL